MALMKGRRIAPDPWRRLPDGDPLPGAGDIVVSLARWRAEPDRLAEHPGRVGLQLRAEDSIAALEGALDGIDLVSIEFDAVTEGRGYSQARLLRERCGFRGELRAVGDVSRDRLAFMAGCGFDAFELRSTEDPAQALAAFDEISVTYQPGAA